MYFLFLLILKSIYFLNLLWREIEGDWITIVFLLWLVLYIFVKNRSKESLWQEIQQLLFTGQYQNHDKTTFTGNHLLILLANGISMALILSFLFRAYMPNVGSDSHILLFLKCIVFIVVYYVFRWFVLWALGQLFDIRKPLKLFVSMLLSVVFMFTILLFSTAIAHHYIASSSHNYFLIGGTVFACVCYVFLKLKNLWNLKKMLGFRKMHFILYLCTLEITPLLLVGRIIYLTI